MFGKPKGSWFKTFLELPNGIPSHDTFGVKGNQGTLHEEVKLFLDDAIGQDFKKTRHDFHKTVDGGHGRIETRSLWCTAQIEWLQDRSAWAGFKSIAAVECERTENKKTTIGRRY